MEVGEAIKVRTYYGNEFTSIQDATLFRDGRLEIHEKPVIEEDEFKE